MKKIIIIVILIVMFSLGLGAFSISGQIYAKLNGQADIMQETESRLKNQMEEKYGIVIIHSEGDYGYKLGYGASFMTDDGIEFVAWDRNDTVIDFYMEQFWSKKVIDKWGYASQFIPHVADVTINVGYLFEENKNIVQLNEPIEQMKDELLIHIYVDLNIPYSEETATDIEVGILNYYQKIQEDGGEGIELIVRYKQAKNYKSASYMIIRDEYGELPIISDVDSVSRTLHIFD